MCSAHSIHSVRLAVALIEVPVPVTVRRAGAGELPRQGCRLAAHRCHNDAPPSCDRTARPPDVAVETGAVFGQVVAVGANGQELPHQMAQQNVVGARTDRQMMIGHRRRLSTSRIDDEQLTASRTELAQPADRVGNGVAMTVRHDGVGTDEHQQSDLS